MYDYFFVFHSLTKAQQAANHLRDQNIAAIVASSPQDAYSAGCTFSVKVKNTDSLRSTRALKNAGIHYLKAVRLGKPNSEEGLW